MGWTLVYMVLILKIPLVAALILIWYAIKEPEPEQGTSDEDRRPRRKPPQRPRWPRRGPRSGAGCRSVPCPELMSTRLERQAPTYTRRG
jgi:hypothetical protein